MLHTDNRLASVIVFLVEIISWAQRASSISEPWRASLARRRRGRLTVRHVKHEPEPVRDAKLLKYIGQMALHRALRNVQRGRDLLVARPSHDQPNDLFFARRQCS